MSKQSFAINNHRNLGDPNNIKHEIHQGMAPRNQKDANSDWAPKGDPYVKKNPTPQQNQEQPYQNSQNQQAVEQPKAQQVPKQQQQPQQKREDFQTRGTSCGGGKSTGFW
ncbi:Hypothetical_protein [Hexamita inflata]|uniref:Hypothetical_protein n=1 Tax=Hexamita inflata TaxID=28002 RepID=A0AA86NQ99_9EUKA|nr:Hypothetical protein HINF_LOCUS10415 [Hexamita inflata]